MVKFTCTIKKFGEQGDKTGWTYLEVPESTASGLLPGNKKSFRVKGRLDSYTFQAISLLPAGGGDFIMPLNAEIRKSIGKSKGHLVTVEMEVDNSPVQISPDLLQCLSDEPGALAFFNKLSNSHKNYYSNWIESAKTIETKTRRITEAVIACSRSQHFGEMMRSIKSANDLSKKF